MRPIKFKTWYGGKMHFWGITKPDENGSRMFAPPVDLHAPQLQFTGLLDKNGKEIYEKDIVRLKTTGLKMVVEWRNRGHWEPFVHADNETPYLQQIYASDCEVISNIYENPELL
jgi:hypothetical protein